MPAARHKSLYQALGRHAVHPFPARMAPEIALELLKPSKKRLRVLDPMMGSGTVVALARSNKHRAYGVDIDPLASLIASVWTTTVDATRVRRTACQVLRRAHKGLVRIAIRDAYPKAATSATKRFIRYWFDRSTRRQLTALARSISGVRDNKIRDLLWCSFSRLIIAKKEGASLALDLAHSRPHKYYSKAPIEPFDKFLSSVEFVLKNTIPKEAGTRGPKAHLQKGDARKLPIKGASIDLVLTSPPYLNAIDYIRCSKFSLVWMGHNIDDLTTIRKHSVGTEVGRDLGNDKEVAAIVKDLRIGKLSSRFRAIVASYVDDMRSAIREVHRVLVPGGAAIYVIGENTVTGTYIRNARILVALARRSGLSLKSETRRALPPNRRYMPPPRRKGEAAFDSRMRTEVVLRFEKPRRKSA